MRPRYRSILPVAPLTVLALLLVAEARAQDVGGDPEPSPPGGGVRVIQAPQQGAVTRDVYVPPVGLPPPGFDVNANLPSSSRPTTDVSGSSDTFDLAVDPGVGAAMTGNENGAPSLRRASVRPLGSLPEIHTVRRGDTLWGLCEEYYDNPWAWPKLWSYNPQVQNPHWIYPGDELRLRGAGDERGAFGRGGSGMAVTQPLRGGRSTLGEGALPLWNIGYIADPERDKVGEVVGAREDRMLLGDEAHLYLLMNPEADVEVGREFTVYKPIRAADDAPGARTPPGQIIRVQGRVRVERYNPKTRVAQATVLEAMDAIERGSFIGPRGAKLEGVTPKPSDENLWARVLRSVYPLVFYGSKQIIFLDRGSEDGLEPGNRLFVVRRGDAWRRSLTLSQEMARERAVMEASEPAVFETTPLKGDEKDFPEEQIGVLRILRTNKHSSVAYVIEASREIVAGDRAVARKGL